MMPYDSNVILNTGYGRPSVTKLKNYYKRFENVQDIDESFIGKEVIILYKYPKLLYGNYHQDILYYGIFSEGPVHKYKTHLWIKDYKKNDPGIISKRRFNGENSLLTLLMQNKDIESLKPK